jgi:hypothetical protein
MRDGKEVGFSKEHDPEEWIPVAERSYSSKLVMWNWNSGILGPYLA